jgi:hypothetical protein
MRLLTVINEEIEQLKNIDNLDILVRDNSEDIETKSIVEQSEFAAKPWFNYRKNEGNVGFDSNVLNSFCEAKGNYVWLVGDDDIIFKDSIRKVFELIELDPDLLHLPFRQPQNLIKPQYQLTPKIKYWTTVQGVVEQILSNIKITSFVFKNITPLLDREKLSRNYSGSGWMHLVLAFEVLLHSNKITTISSAEFFAGSFDKEWKVINWTPTAYLTAKSFYEHEIFRKYNLNRQLKKFELQLYYAGLNMTWLVTRGVWATTVSMNEYLDFGSKYPFRPGLLLRPRIFLKYVLIRLRLGTYFNFTKHSNIEKK